MPSGKSVTPLFGTFLILLNLFLSSKENKALAAVPGAGAPPPYIVVLDPGHGGEDKGAVGEIGGAKGKRGKPLYEKDVALGIAIRTAKMLQDPKFSRALGRRVKVVMTRDRDREVSLEARSAAAHEAKADLFVSIHCNSDPSGRAHGVETFFLNNTDQESDSKLEEIENRSSKKYAGRPPEALLIRTIMADAVVESSRLAAETVHKSLVDHLRSQDGHATDRGVKQAMFYVLLDAQVPGILFEAMFVNHKADAAYLSDGANRQKLAEGLAKGILRYLALQ